MVKNPSANPEDIRDAGSVPLEKGMATNILAWRIPWTEEPGGLQVHRVTKSQTWLKQLKACIHCSLSDWKSKYLPSGWSQNVSFFCTFYNCGLIALHGFPSIHSPVWTSHLLLNLGVPQEPFWVTDFFFFLLGNWFRDHSGFRQGD